MPTATPHASSTRRATWTAAFVASATALAGLAAGAGSSSAATPSRGSAVVTAAQDATARTPARRAPSVHLDRVVSGLATPIDVASPPGSGDLYIAQQCGVIKVLRHSTLRRAGSLKSKTHCDGERGLLSIAFDPEFKTNHRLFVYFTRKGTGDIQIGRVEVRKRHLVAGSYRNILRIRHRQDAHHNGGKLVFDDAGMLYISTGDGGGSGNQFGHSQDHGSMLGKILRINVHGKAPYSIPRDNPLVGHKGHKEIWAIGLRNPWRMSLDSATNRLWVGDVGQSRIEEVDQVKAGGKKLLNFGWSRFEGRRIYDRSEKLRGGKLVKPRFTYRHSQGRSIIGGGVYRGSERALRGYYVYGDLTGWIGGFDIKKKSSQFRINPGGTLLTISQAGGELYAGFADGSVYQIVTG